MLPDARHLIYIGRCPCTAAREGMNSQDNLHVKEGNVWHTRTCMFVCMCSCARNWTIVLLWRPQGAIRMNFWTFYGHRPIGIIMFVVLESERCTFLFNPCRVYNLPPPRDIARVLGTGFPRPPKHIFSNKLMAPPPLFQIVALCCTNVGPICRVFLKHSPDMLF